MPGTNRVAERSEGSRHRWKSARRVLLERGIAAVSVRDLTTALGMSTHEAYREFGGKWEIVGEILDYERSAIWLRARDVAATESADRVVRRWLEEIEHLAHSGNVPLGMVLTSLAANSPALPDFLRSRVAATQNHIVDWIADALAATSRKSATPGNREVAEFVMAALTGSIVLACADRDYWEFNNGLARLKEYVASL